VSSGSVEVTLFSISRLFGLIPGMGGYPLLAVGRVVDDAEAILLADLVLLAD
jgi:hypothetical protein